MRFISEQEWKEIQEIWRIHIKLYKEFKEDKIDKLTFLENMEKISDRLIKIASFKTKSFEEFERFCMSLGNEYGIEDIKERIQHEREHAKVMEKYEVDLIYCFVMTAPILLPSPSIFIIERQPNIKHFHQAYVVDSIHLKVDWSKEEILSYLKESHLAGTKGHLDEKLGKIDREFLKVL